jgi:hypothetical protein
MTTRRDTPSASLDEVLARYASKASDFNAEVLERFIDEYPQYAEALRRYAHVQLVSIPATAEEVEREDTPDHEMLPMQSKLLFRMQQLRATPSAEELRDAEKKLGAIKGKRAIHEATRAVFGSTEAGQDALFVCVMGAPGVTDVPDWFSETLAAHVGSQVAAIRHAVAKRQSGRAIIRLQRFSAPERLKRAEPCSWSEAVEQNIKDPTIKERLLSRP